MKSGQVIDIKEALKYPLSPILVVLGFPDGTKRRPAISSLMKIIDHSSSRRWCICQCWCIHCRFNGWNPSCRYFLDSRRAAHQPSTIHHSKRLWKRVTGKSLGKTPQVQLDVRDNLPSWSQQKLRSKTRMPSNQLAYWQQKENIEYTENNKPVPVGRRILSTIANIRCQLHRQPDVKTWRGKF